MNEGSGTTAADNAQAAPEGLSPGSDLNGTYQIVRRLFEGGMGDIYEARHARLTGRYAVKVLRRELTAKHGSALSRFRREAEVTSSLRHPHIVQVLDFNQTEAGAAYFVMELLEGLHLGQHIATFGPLDVTEAAIIVGQVAAALAAAHKNGVVHRDLKPENIHLVDLPGRKEPFAKVLDFGISKVLAATTLTQERIVVGTPAYMAPEQARGVSDDLDGRTDEFALGAIAYELLTGRRAFQGDTVAAILYQVVHEDPPSLAPLVGDAVDAVVRRALAKDREHRYPSVTAFAEDLRVAVFGPVPVGGARPVDSGASRSKHTVDSGVVQAIATGRSGEGGSTSGFSSAGAAHTGDVTAPQHHDSHRRIPGLILAGTLFVVAAMCGAAWMNRDVSTWTSADGDRDALALGGQVALSLRRLVDDEIEQVADAAARAAKVPNLRNAVTDGIDEATFRDILANETWWADYRAMGCAVIVGGQTLVTWHYPTKELDPRALVDSLRTTAGPATGEATAGLSPGPAVHAAVIPDSVGATVAAAAPIANLQGAILLLTRAVDRALVADLASRVNTVLLVSDGHRAMVASVPDNTLPELGLLVGRESARIVVDHRHRRLAAAIPWTPALWLWGITVWGT